MIQSTEYCMSKVEDEFMERASKNVSGLEKFINEIPYWTAEEQQRKYRLMYQVYTYSKYREYGKKFFDGVNKRYTEYEKQLSEKVKIPSDTLISLIFIFVRAFVHYALFEDEFYLKSQLKVLKK